jgi:Uncharacterized secreted protein
VRKDPRPALRLALFIMGSTAGLAHAATGTLTASVSVDTNCTVSTSPVTFGAYDPIVANVAGTGIDLPGTGTITVTCVKGSAPSIALGLGLYSTGSTRRMRHATAATTFLTYELYQPPSATPGAACSYVGATVWGSGTSAFSPGAAPNKNSRIFNVCGTVPAGQNVEVGTYSDTVTATITF